MALNLFRISLTSGVSKENNITLHFIQPGKPTQNAFVERCNGNVRKELLNANIFKSIAEFRLKAEEYKADYNYDRPHSSLNYKTPNEVKEEIATTMMLKC